MQKTRRTESSFVDTYESKGEHVIEQTSRFRTDWRRVVVIKERVYVYIFFLRFLFFIRCYFRCRVFSQNFDGCTWPSSRCGVENTASLLFIVRFQVFRHKWKVILGKSVGTEFVEQSLAFLNKFTFDRSVDFAPWSRDRFTCNINRS